MILLRSPTVTKIEIYIYLSFNSTDISFKIYQVVTADTIIGNRYQGHFRIFR